MSATKALRGAGWSLLDTIPQVKILRKQSTTWEDQPRRRFVVGSHDVRSVQCARMNLIDVMSSYLKHASDSDIWPDFLQF